MDSGVSEAKSKSKREAGARCWCFTIPNYTTVDIVDRDDVKYAIAGREICPTTGTPHLQCFVWFNGQLRFSTIKKKYPLWRNIDKMKGTPWQNFVYCSKDGDFIEIGERPTESKTQQKRNRDTAFSDALNAPSVQEGLKIIKTQAARDYCLHGDAIERNLKRAKVTRWVKKYTLGDFEAKKLPLDNTTLIVGPSGIGKTHFACAHFENPLIVTHMDKLREFSTDYDGIVFDDMSFKHIPPEAVIHLVDNEFNADIHCRYGCATIPAFTKKIFTHNTNNPFYDIEKTDSEQQTAIERRVTRVVFKNKLFKNNDKNDDIDISIDDTEEI